MRVELRPGSGVAAGHEDLHIRRRVPERDGVQDRAGPRIVAEAGSNMTTDAAGGGIMTPTEMDQLTTPAEPIAAPDADLLPPAPYSRFPTACFEL